jgi:hypothetical protein
MNTNTALVLMSTGRFSRSSCTNPEMLSSNSTLKSSLAAPNEWTTFFIYVTAAYHSVRESVADQQRVVQLGRCLGLHLRLGVFHEQLEEVVDGQLAQTVCVRRQVPFMK